ncbi:hypothetical protein Tco_0592538 [Tanacetum coccineum]
MTTLKFADTHNMVAFLSKPTESEGFEQIVDSLNAHSIKNALMLQALMDGKKIIITGSIIRSDLQLEDVEGVDCLPNATIFEQLALMGSKTTAWNKFSSTMASAIICLATNQKFNFSKYIFESMVKNLDNVGKGFSGRETPLFQTMVVQDHAKIGEGSEIHTDPHHTPTFIQPSTSQPQMKQRSRSLKRKDTQVPRTSVPSDNVTDEAVNEEMDDSLVRAATTVTSLDAEQDRGNINKTQSKATLNEPSSPGTSSGSGPRGNTLQSGEDRLKLKELMELCTNLQTRVLDLETTKTTQANEIASLKRRVKKLERRNKSSTHRLKILYRVGSSRRVESFEDDGLGEEEASKQGMIADIDANEDIYLVNVQTDEDMFGVNDLDGDEVIVESVDVVNTTKETRSVVEEVTVVTIPVSTTTTTTKTTIITNVEITLAQALAKLKSVKPKVDKVVIQEPEQGTTTTPTLTTTTAATTTIVDSTRPKAKGIIKVQDKGKGKMVELEHVKKMFKKDLLRLDEELAFKLQAEEEEEEERLAIEKAQQVEEANRAWDEVQAKIEADYQLAQRLQAQEQDD